MQLYALNRDFELVSIGIPYDNLQWNRRYYDFGDFTVQLPIQYYDDSWAYIGADERPELGMVQKVYGTGDSSMNIQVSGFFCEKMLDDKTCYPRYIGDASKTETAVRNIFDKYKDDLKITLAPANNPLLGDRTQSNFSDDQLGTKLFRILESRELSYRVIFDYETNKLTLSVWQGLDRTQSQTKNSFQTFSMEFGNIGNRDVNIDDSAYKNYAIIPCNGDSNNVEQNVYYVDISNGAYKREIVLPHREDKPEENESMADFETRIKDAVIQELLDYQIVEDINLIPVSDNEYMIDYDLGDKCDVVLSDLGIEMETRIVEINEVFKASGHTISIGLGNKRISNMKRLVNTR